MRTILLIIALGQLSSPVMSSETKRLAEDIYTLSTFDDRLEAWHRDVKIVLGLKPFEALYRPLVPADLSPDLWHLRHPDKPNTPYDTNRYQYQIMQSLQNVVHLKQRLGPLKHRLQLISQNINQLEQRLRGYPIKPGRQLHHCRYQSNTGNARTLKKVCERLLQGDGFDMSSSLIEVVHHTASHLQKRADRLWRFWNAQIDRLVAEEKQLHSAARALLAWIEAGHSKPDRPVGKEDAANVTLPPVL